MQAVRSHDEILDANTRYHDVAAASYDVKWGIDFGEIGRRQVLGKVGKLLDGVPEARSFGRALEIGAGTGYFSLNLMKAGLITQLTCTDISPGMLSALTDNALNLGLLDVRTIRADGESLPFPDGSFDVVLGHAILHHLPDLDRAFAEFHRVLAPGGRIVFAGEPSRLGDLLAWVPKQAAVTLAPAWRAALRAGPADAHEHTESDHDHELEQVVDIHAFAPGDLLRLARNAGFTDAVVRGEELLANWFGWFNRGLEASARPDDVPMLWRQYAFRGYLALQRLDAWGLEPRLPPAVFYNLLLGATKAG